MTTTEAKSLVVVACAAALFLMSQLIAKKTEVVCSWCARKQDQITGRFTTVDPETLKGKPIAHTVCDDCRKKNRDVVRFETEFITRSMA
jgi:uncharacterized protein YlaI